MASVSQQMLLAAGVPPPALGIAGTPVTTGTEYEHGVGSVYAGFTATASGGYPPYTYSISAGTLPAGITLNGSTGAVSGTPAFESAGTYAGIVIRVTDNVGTTADLASFTLTIAFKDPYYANVNFLLDYDAANGNTVFTDQKSGSAMTTRGDAKHSTAVTPLYGTSSFLFDGNVDAAQFGDTAAWTIGAASFTIDFTAYPTNLTGVKYWFSHWLNAPTLGWTLYQNADTVGFNLSTTGSDNITQVQSPAGSLVVNTWARWRLDFNGTKYRLYKTGMMVASSTTVRTIFDSSDVLSVGNASTASGTTTGFIGNARGVRLTVGTARTASDSGYTISNRAFPTS
jgi:Putative Ig domain